VNLPSLSSGKLWNSTKLYTTGVLSVIDSNFLPGDVDLDGHVNIADASALMSALSDLTTYQSTHGPGGSALTNQQLLQIADLDGDGTVTDADVQGLINLLANGAGSVALGGSGGDALNPVPEPSAMVLSLFGAVACMISLGRSRSLRS
jgi:hypothetical protein